MPATVSADLSRLGQGARLHAGKVFRRKDLAASLPSVDRELGRALKAGLEQPEPLWGAGLLLFAVLLLEPFGLRWKLRFLRRLQTLSDQRGGIHVSFYDANDAPISRTQG